MLLFKKTRDLASWLQAARKAGDNIGFAPTMGALHQGHLSLIEASRKQNKKTVVSIFVNPAQFNDKKDFEKYPVTIEQDIELLVSAGCDVLYLPSAEEIYPDGYDTPSHYDLGYLETVLEGKYRPGHFQGVCKVMHRLLDIVKPDNLYMGQKDYQQCMVVKRLMQITGAAAVFHTCPTLRDTDGLAMSSRNTRLNAADRKKAVTISAVLNRIRKEIQPGDLGPLLRSSTALLEKNDFRVDYVAVADATTLELKASWDGKEKLVALIAAFQHEVRLIDNMLLN